MKAKYYAGLDIHKKTITICMKDKEGKIIRQSTIKARPQSIADWVAEAPKPFSVLMEATLFSGWIYDEFKKYSKDVRAGNPAQMSYIAKSKHKDDKLDAEKLADLLRVDMVPEVTMLPTEARNVRNLLRYRNWLVKETTRFKNKISNQLMSHGIEYEDRRLHGKRYFTEFVGGLKENPDLATILKMSRNQMDMLITFERASRKLIYEHPGIEERVDMLMTIPGVGEITALSWALEIWEPKRFTANGAISYCGLCQGRNSSAGAEKSGPISKMRNKRLQWVLVEAAKAAIFKKKSKRLTEIYESVRSGKHHNAATIAVARQLVKWLLAVDKRGTSFIDYEYVSKTDTESYPPSARIEF